jgi:hypothetical protein
MREGLKGGGGGAGGGRSSYELGFSAVSYSSAPRRICVEAQGAGFARLRWSKDGASDDMFGCGKKNVQMFRRGFAKGVRLREG